MRTKYWEKTHLGWTDNSRWHKITTQTRGKLQKDIHTNLHALEEDNSKVSRSIFTWNKFFLLVPSLAFAMQIVLRGAPLLFPPDCFRFCHSRAAVRVGGETSFFTPQKLFLRLPYSQLLSSCFPKSTSYFPLWFFFPLKDCLCQATLVFLYARHGLSSTNFINTRLLITVVYSY